MQSFIALITPMGDSGARPDNSLPGGQGGRPDNTLPGFQPRPDQGLPGNQPYPDQGLPGGQGGYPDNSLPGGQGGRPDQSLPPFPSHPIYLPPDAGEDEPRLVSKVIWAPQIGWVVVFVPTGPTPTPSS